MAFTCGFFNSVSGDRRYNSQQLSSIFDGIITDGVFAHYGSHFEITPVDGMNINVGSGRFWFNHVWGLNDGNTVVTLDPADISSSRVDAIVAEIDHRDEVRNAFIKVVKGAPGSGNPTLSQENNVYQYPLAYVTVPASATSISASNIQVIVGTSECPFATSVLESVNVDNLFDQWDAQFQEWFQGVQNELEGDIVTNLINQINQLKASKADITYVDNNMTGVYKPTRGDILISKNYPTTLGFTRCTGSEITVSASDALYGQLDILYYDNYEIPNVNSFDADSTVVTEYGNVVCFGKKNTDSTYMMYSHSPNGNVNSVSLYGTSAGSNILYGDNYICVYYLERSSNLIRIYTYNISNSGAIYRYINGVTFPIPLSGYSNIYSKAVTYLNGVFIQVNVETYTYLYYVDGSSTTPVTSNVTLPHYLNGISPTSTNVAFEYNDKIIIPSMPYYNGSVYLQLLEINKQTKQIIQSRTLSRSNVSVGSDSRNVFYYKNGDYLFAGGFYTTGTSNTMQYRLSSLTISLSTNSIVNTTDVAFESGRTLSNVSFFLYDDAVYCFIPEYKNNIKAYHNSVSLLKVSLQHGYVNTITTIPNCETLGSAFNYYTVSNNKIWIVVRNYFKKSIDVLRYDLSKSLITSRIPIMVDVGSYSSMMIKSFDKTGIIQYVYYSGSVYNFTTFSKSMSVQKLPYIINGYIKI